MKNFYHTLLPVICFSDHSKGFGGKYGVESDRVDKSAKGWSDHSQTELHPSQTDHKKGFGGKFGVDENMDKSAAKWTDKSESELHSSQTDHKKGFGGKFGVETEGQDKVSFLFILCIILWVAIHINFN